MDLWRPESWLAMPIAPRGWVAVSLSSVAIFMMGGVVFGLSGLYPFMYRQKMWASVCGGECQKECLDAGAFKCCDDQLVQLSLLASVAFFVSDASAALWGEIVDRIGGRSCLALSVAVFCSAFVTMGAGAAQGDELVTATAIMVLAFAGPGATSNSKSMTSSLP